MAGADVMAAPWPRIESASNPVLKQWRRLHGHGSAYRNEGVCWLEGEHLIEAALQQGVRLQRVIWRDAPAAFALPPDVPQAVMASALWRQVSQLDQPPTVAAQMAWPGAGELRPDAATVVLDAVQDPGNVGAVLRSAAAFGYQQVVALRGSAGLWSPKVLRAAMGAHFALHLVEDQPVTALTGLRVPLWATSSHRGQWLHQLPRVWPCAWLIGNEGKGLSDQAASYAAQWVRIAQPGGQESLNAAVAAGICLYSTRAAASDEPPG